MAYLGIFVFFGLWATPSQKIKSFEDIVQLIERENIRTKEQFLAALPAEYRRNYILFFESESPHGASPTNPRTKVFSDDGRFVLVFGGGDSDNSNNNTVEIRETLKSNKQVPRVIEFAKDQKSAPAIVRDPVSKYKHHPTKNCAACHTPRFVTRWDSYNFWPKNFGSQEAESPPQEEALFKKFVGSNGKNKFFRLLKNLENMDLFILGERSARFTTLAYRNSEAAFVENIKRNPKIQELKKYILLASALSDYDSDQFGKILPPHLQVQYENEIEKIEQEILNSNKKYRDEKKKVYTRSVGIPSKGFEISRHDFDSTDARKYANLQFLLQKSGVDLRDWSPVKKRGPITFAGPISSFSGFSKAFSEQLFSDEDRDFLKHFRTQENAIAFDLKGPESAIKTKTLHTRIEDVVDYFQTSTSSSSSNPCQAGMRLLGEVLTKK